MKKNKLLVADDDPDILSFMKIFLESLGYEIDTESNGDKILSHNLPDLYLLRSCHVWY